MEECNNNDKRKRVRDDSEVDSSESKHLRVDSDSDANSSESQLTRLNSSESCMDSNGYELVRVEPEDSLLDSSEVKDIPDDLLNMFDDADNVTERDPIVQMQGLDSVIKSFEEEILAPVSYPDPDVESVSGEFKLNLGYLLEASDDELGLPPTVASTEKEGRRESDDSGRVGPEGLDLTGFLGFEDEFRNYEAFGLVGYDADDNGGGYVTIDGLFDYSEPVDILWRSESLQAM
ncbi:uncharacterized protein LOC133290876 [Gastrolobium bilobum]|uniref:uncharacterized protein LOC133290876 n=1 Tax=Gastrolobium bilobum TaxID=150636 RepID=UPI002AB2251C|nr:uncharacterized protein LOC133290876 [Gastrolobium bilobum]